MISGLPAVLCTITFVFGAIVGSFLNVIIYRLPRGKSIVSPPSHCPECKVPIKPWQNIPVVSYLMLRGRCKSCGAEIPLRYPAIEAVTALSYLAIYLLKDFKFSEIYIYLLFPFLIAVSAIDIEVRKIPNRLLSPVLVAAVFLMLITNFERWLELLIAAFASASLLLLISLASRGGMGMGDVKFIFVLGIFLGKFVFEALALAVLLGGLVSIVLLAVRLKTRKQAIPFGPYLAVGGSVSALWGGLILNWYLSLFSAG